MTVQSSRRIFLKGSVASGVALVVGYNAVGALAKQTAAELMPNPFVRIAPDGTVTVILKHFETGQGTSTGLATLVAEELDADWEAVEIEFAPSDNARYKNLFFGAQATGGSTAIANSFMQYRQAGAAVRSMLQQAAAEKWGVSAETVTVNRGVLKSGPNEATFADVVETAIKFDPPAEPKLKDPSRFNLIGKEIPRKDSNSKTDGTAVYALDVRVPNMVYSVMARPPKFGAVVAGFDDRATRQVNGVVDVKQTPKGVVVYATNTWAAIKGRRVLEVEWDFADAETRSSQEMLAAYRAAVAEPGVPARHGSDFVATAQALGAAGDNVIEAEFVFPFLAHAPMEPLNCVIEPVGNGVVVHDGCQAPGMAHPNIAGVLGIPPERVQINTVYAGGSFGRRVNTSADYQVEAALAFKALGGDRAVKHVWTREDDLAGGYYRSMFVHKVRAAVGQNGATAWDHRIAGQSIAKGTPMEDRMTEGFDDSSVEGAADTPYNIPMMAVGSHLMESPIPVLWWRSVGHSHSAFAMESMMDMLAEKVGADPVEFRLKHLMGDSSDHKRLRGVLKLAAEKAGWGEKMGNGKGRGIALHKSFDTYVAEVAVVSVNGNGAVKIDRVVCAVDCGIVVNPDVVRAQMEGGIGFGLGAAMRNHISLDGGTVEQENFPDYEPLRISDMPSVEVHIVDSTEPPTGVGEPGLPPIAAAVGNAIHAATGIRATALPFADNGVEFA